MSTYPPLTEANLLTLNEASARVIELRRQVYDLGLPICDRPGDEDNLTFAVSTMRNFVQRLDQELFRIYGLVHRLKSSNVPTTLVEPLKRPPPSLDDLEGMTQ